MKNKSIFTTTDLIIVGATITIAVLSIIGLGFDVISIGATGIHFNF